MSDLIERLQNLVDMEMPIEVAELSVLTEAADALQQAQQIQRVTANTVTQQDELLNMHAERITELEAALDSIRFATDGRAAFTTIFELADRALVSDNEQLSGE